jgi:YD repeat-containing protein
MTGVSRRGNHLLSFIARCTNCTSPEVDRAPAKGRAFRRKTGLGRLHVFPLFIVFFLAGLTPAPAQASYAYRRVVTIAHSKVPNTDQTNFPVLISGTYSYLATISNGGNVTNSNGYDIIFTSDAAGTSTLAFERESYNAATGAVIYWVKVPTVSHTADTAIYMFYGNSSVTTDQSNKTGVWDGNYNGVWHLPNGTTLTANDSTNNGNNATVYGTPAATAGQIDGAATFGASTANYMQAADAASLRIASTITLSAWIYNTSDNSNGGGLIAEKRDATNPANNYNYGFWLQTGGQLFFQFNDGSYESGASSTGAVPKNAWTYVAVSVNDSTQLVSFYVNGSLNSTATKSGTMPSSGTGVLQIGNYGTYNGGGYSFEGNLDEVRISNTIRSADWIATEYNNQNSPSTFYSIGSATNSPSISSLSQSSGAVGTSITITGAIFGSTQGTSSVTFNGTVASPTSWNDTSIVAPVPSGATPGDVVVTVSSIASNGTFFTVPISWSNGYGLRRTIIIDHTKVPNTDQTNFPVLISGTYSYLATTSNGGSVTNTSGYDIIFTSDAAGTSNLAYERETYNPSTGAVNLWVKLPTVSHTPTETVFYMFYSNPSVITDQSSAAAVWDGNFKGVWHLPNGTSLTANDSTSNSNNGTVHGTPAATAGQIDGAASFGASTADYLQAGDASSLRIASTITLSAWIYNTSDNSNGGIILEKRDATNPANNYNYGLSLQPGGQLLFQFNDGSYQSSTTSTGAVPKNAWTHIVTTVDESTQHVSFYVNGSLNSTTTKSGTMPSSGTGVLQIGNYGTFNGGVYSLNGNLDELRISNIVRSADWIATEYSNENSPSTFYSIGPALNPNITSLSPTLGAVGATVTITGTDFGPIQGVSTVTFNGIAATPTSWNTTSIVVPVPLGATTGNVAVTVGTVTSYGIGFSVLSAPSITSLSSTSGAAGASVTVSGANFGATQGTGTVKFNGTTASVSSWSATSIGGTVPSGAISGTVVVNTSGVNSNGVFYTVLTTLSGVVTRQSDSSAVSGATVQALQGGAVKKTATTASNGTYTISNLAVGTYDIKFSASGLGSAVQFAVSILGPTTVNRALSSPGTVSGQVTQSNGTTAISGATAAIIQNGEPIATATTNGSGNYSIPNVGATSYQLQVSASGYVTQDQSVSVMSGTTTTANFSLYASDTVPINYVYDKLGRVVAAIDQAGDAAGYNYDAVGNILSISRGSTHQLSIISFTPGFGPTGSTVTIYGTGFSATPSQDTVKFNGTTATVTTASLTSLVVTVPSGATTGTISVTTSAGTATSSTSFTVSTTAPGQPTISSFTPTVGAAATSITITGTNFETIPANDKLSLNIASAQVSSATATSLSTTVPSGATSGRLTLATPGGTTTSSNDFIVPPSPYTASSIDTAGRVSVGGSYTATITSASHVDLVLFDGLAGHKISITLLSDTLTNSGGTAQFKISNPNGTLLTQPSLSNSSTYMDEQTLSANGTYTILIIPNSSATGSIAFTLNDATDLAGTIVTDGTSVTATTTIPGQNYILRFSGTSGQLVSGQWWTSNVSPSYALLEILAPNGANLFNTIRGGTTGNNYVFSDPVTLPSTGTYIALFDPEGPSTGTLTVVLYNVVNWTGSASVGGSGVNVSLATPGQDGILTFSGTASQQVTVHVTNNTYGYITVALKDPSGTTLTSNSSSGNFNLSTQTLSTTGTYTVYLSHYSASTGSVTVTLTSP